MEVLMVRRRADARFMGGARVFPGGGVDDADHGEQAAAAVAWAGDPEELPWRAAALRELVEEAGIVIADRPVGLAGLRGREVFDAVLRAGAALDAGRLGYVSNWVTPAGLPTRFDTRFYLVEVDTATRAASDDAEVFDAVWVEPSTALVLGRSGEWLIEVPTRVHLELLADLGGVDAVAAYVATVRPQRVEPVLETDAGGSPRVVLPDGSSLEVAGGR
jgi:recombination protein RecT